MGEKLDSLLRTFKGKKSPEMITDSSYDQLRNSNSTTDDSNPNTLNDLTLGIYNVFGLPLEDAAKINELFEDSNNFTPSQNSWESQLCFPEYQKYVPKMILKCVRFINDYGLKEEGLYRVSGSGQQVKELKEAFSQHGPSYDIPPITDVHVVTSLIKQFVRELPSDLLPVKRHTFLAYTKQDLPTELSFSQGMANFSVFTAEEEDLNPVVIPTQILQEILQGLTPHQFALVQTLVRHFSLIVENSKFNRMTLASLSVILCPTLKIHKSVFHALILKSPRVWLDLHPKESEISARSVKYDPSKIMAYCMDDMGFPNPESSSSFVTGVSGSTPSSSNTSVAEVVTGAVSGSNSTNTSITAEHALLDPISLSIFNSSNMLDKNCHTRESIMFRTDHESGIDEYFDNGVISFSNPLDYSKLHAEPIIPSTSSSLSSFSDSSHNSRYSDSAEYYSDHMKHPPPQFSSSAEYRYKQSDGTSSSGSLNSSTLSTSKLKALSSNRALNASTNGNNRTLFLRKSVGQFNV